MKMAMSGYGKQILVTSALMVVIVVGVGVGVYYLHLGPVSTTTAPLSSTTSAMSLSSSSTSSASTSSSSSSNVLTYSSCNDTITLNGTDYCTLNVSNEILLGNPGYSIFNTPDSSISFNGVTFTLLCPSGYIGCPNTSHNSTMVGLYIGVIDLRLTFPNNVVETISNFVPEPPDNLTMLSNITTPSAGMYIEFVQHGYQTFLIVQQPS